MATLGNTATPGGGYFYDVTGNSQFYNNFSASGVSGSITDVYVYAAGYGGGVTAQLVIWQNNNIIWQSGNFTMGAATSVSIGGQAWQHFSVPSVYFSGGTISIGVWSSGSVIWTYESGGGVTGYQRTSSPATLVQGSSEAGGPLGAYIVYSPGSIRVWNGSSWVVTEPQVWNGSAWVSGTAYVWNGSSWVAGS